MSEINMTVDKLARGEESERSYPVGNKTDAMPDSSAMRYSYNNGIINHEGFSDEELVRSFVKTQDEEAFNEIVNRYADKIFRLALRITRNPSDAEEVLQDVFLSMEKLGTFRGDSKFSTWLYRVAANASNMHLRTNKKKYKNEVNLEDYVSYNGSGALEGVQVKDWSDVPEEVLLSREGMEIIVRAVNELPELYRIVFHLRDVEGLTNPEVAKILGLSLPNVKSRVLRARLFLRDKLSDYFYEWKK